MTCFLRNLPFFLRNLPFCLNFDVKLQILTFFSEIRFYFLWIFTLNSEVGLFSINFDSKLQILTFSQKSDLELEILNFDIKLKGLIF